MAKKKNTRVNVIVGTAGIYRYEARRVRGACRIAFKNPGGRVVGKGSSKTFQQAATKAAAASDDEGLKLTVRSYYFMF